uniref:glutathione transferase n=1 Tax=Oryza glaberrima TaxID=4538 RepID=I1QL56_ORYGL
MAGLSTGAGAPVVKLYHEKSMILPDVSRVLACLYEKNIEFETVKDSYKDILRLQASRSVPVPFYDGPTFLQESRAICRYIAETYEQRGYPFLLGKDVLERASIEQWLRHEEHAFDPPSRALFCHLAFPVQDDDDDDINTEKRKLEEVLEVYEQRLGESEFLAGNKFTLADLVHLPNTHHLVTSEFAYLYDSRKNVQRWWDTISNRQSWKQVLKDMNRVEEEYQMELEQQEEQWQTELPQTSVGHTIRLDPRQTTSWHVMSRTILVPPSSAGMISTSFSSQREQPLPSETTRQDKPSPRKESNFFTTTEKTPSTPRSRAPTTQKQPSSTFFTQSTTPKIPQRTDTDISSSKDAPYQTKPSETTSKEAHDKSRFSGFFKARSHTDETATPTKHSPQEDSKTSTKIPKTRDISEAVGPNSPISTKAPHEIDERASVDPRFDKPAPYTKPTTNIPQTSSGRPSAQIDLGTSGTEADKTSSDLGGGVQSPYAQGRAEQVKKTSSDQRGSETAQPAQPHGTQQFTKDARQADQNRIAASPRQQPSESQEDTHNIMSEDERFSTKRLRKMMEESEKEAQEVKSQPTDFRPSREETPSIYKKPSDVQDRTILDDRKSGRSPSAGTRAPDYPTSAAERRVASQPKEGMPYDDRGATKPQKSPSINEQEKIPVVPSQAPPASSGKASESLKEVSPDDGLAQVSTINQWRQTSAPPPTKLAAPHAPRNVELAKTEGVDKRTQPSTTKETPRNDRNVLATGQGADRGVGNEQYDKNSIDERAQQMTPRQAAPSVTQRASASIQERISGAHGASDDKFGKTSSADQSNTPAIPKQTTVQGATPDVRGTSYADREMKLPADEKATANKQKPVSSSQQTIEQIRGGTPTSYGSTDDDLAKTSRANERQTPPSKAQAPASNRQSASTALQGGTPDARGENTAVKPSVTSPTGMPTSSRRQEPTPSVTSPTGVPTSPRRQEPTPDTQRRRAADQMPSQAPLPSSFSTRNKENGISEAGQTNTVAPDGLPDLGVPKDAGPQVAGPSVVKSQKNMNEAYSDGPSTQQLPNDQYRSQPREAKEEQGADAALINEIGKAQKDDLLANPNQSSTGRVQPTSTEETSKQQLQSGLNKPISSKDGKETVSYGSSATSREMLPSIPDKSMRMQQPQGDKSSYSSISQEDNVKQGSQAALQGSGNEQPKKRDLLANADEKIRGTTGEALQKSDEGRISSNTEQMKSNRNNSKPDGSTEPTSFDGNEGNLPESQRRGSSSNP